MPNRLSHSAVSKYLECGRSYQLHYLEKLRPVNQSSALLFGSAVDKGFDAMLQGKDAEKAFLDAWTTAEINKNAIQLINCLAIDYFSSDFDIDLLLEEDWNLLNNEKATVKESYDYKKLAGLAALPDELQVQLQTATWLCMKRKGLLMMKALREQVMPSIEKVYATQAEINLENDVGDKVIGFVDMVVQWKGYKNPLILDLKTSSAKYEADKVISSNQLSLYLHSLADQYKTRDCGYIVLLKKVRKNKIKKCTICQKDGTGFKHKVCDNVVNNERCNGEWDITIDPSIDVQIMINEIESTMEDKIIETMDLANEQIKAGLFPQNFDSCVKKYGRCIYYDLCHAGSTSSLINMKEEK